MNKIYFILLSSLISVLSFSQTTINGSVIDANTGESLNWSVYCIWEMEWELLQIYDGNFVFSSS